MSDHNLHHRRVHNLLVFQKLLALRESSSPFTLILDSLEQPAKTLLQRYIKTAQVRHIEHRHILQFADYRPGGQYPHDFTLLRDQESPAQLK